MKWYKHISDSLDDPFIFDLVDRFGGDGYLVFFGTLEVMSREFNTKLPGSCTLSDRFLTKKLQLSRQKTVKILKFCDENKRIFFEEAGSKFKLYCPKLKELCDEWTSRQLRSSSEVTPKKPRLEVEVEVEEDKDIHKERKKKKEKTESPKSVFGEFKNVKLAEDEYKKLIEKFGEFLTNEKIENLSSGIASKGYKYKSHYATILSWDRKNKKDGIKTGKQYIDPVTDHNMRVVGTFLKNEGIL